MNYKLKATTRYLRLTADFIELAVDGPVSAAWSVPSGLTLVSQSVSQGRVAAVTLSGGVSGIVYPVSVVATNAAGTDARAFDVFATDQDAGDMIPVADLLGFVRGGAKGCPTPLVAAAIAEMAHMFCRESGCWSYRLNGLPIQADVTSLRLPVADGAVVVAVRDLKFSNGMRPNATTPSGITGAEQTSAGHPFSYAHSESTLMLDRAFAQPDALYCVVFMAPAQTGSLIPADLVTHHRDAIVAGALMKLLMMPGETWKDLELAAVNKSIFENEVNRAKVIAITGIAPVQTRVARRRLGN